jgi:hypothetical protein
MAGSFVESALRALSNCFTCPSVFEMLFKISMHVPELHILSKFPIVSFILQTIIVEFELSVTADLPAFLSSSSYRQTLHRRLKITFQLCLEICKF